MIQRQHPFKSIKDIRRIEKKVKKNSTLLNNFDEAILKSFSLIKESKITLDDLLGNNTNNINYNYRLIFNKNKLINGWQVTWQKKNNQLYSCQFSF